MTLVWRQPILVQRLLPRHELMLSDRGLLFLHDIASLHLLGTQHWMRKYTTALD